MTRQRRRDIRRRQRRRRKLRYLKARLGRAANTQERQRLVVRIQKISPRAPIPDR